MGRVDSLQSEDVIKQRHNEPKLCRPFTHTHTKHKLGLRPIQPEASQPRGTTTQQQRCTTSVEATSSGRIPLTHSFIHSPTHLFSCHSFILHSFSFYSFIHLYIYSFILTSCTHSLTHLLIYSHFTRIFIHSVLFNSFSFY